MTGEKNHLFKISQHVIFQLRNWSLIPLSFHQIYMLKFNTCMPVIPILQISLSASYVQIISVTGIVKIGLVHASNRKSYNFVCS